MIPEGRFVNGENAKILKCIGLVKDNQVGDYFCNKRTFLVYNADTYYDKLHYEPFEDGVARVDFGIHPEEIAKVYSSPPFIQKTLTFCPACSQDFFNKLVGGMALHIYGHEELKEDTFQSWVSKFTNWLIGGRNMPEYKPKYGHWITYTQTIIDYSVQFNIQISPNLFLAVVDNLKSDYLPCLRYKYSGEYLYNFTGLHPHFFFSEDLFIE